MVEESEAEELEMGAGGRRKRCGIRGGALRCGDGRGGGGMEDDGRWDERKMGEGLWEGGRGDFII
ncbi:hypothetical protein HPP92_009327 [Vanilla planifolia]|uniref:Uncharacterized protein n=1 Tax=Vanilla planifolia TaxID=51239 RepID=A0A835RJK2_VANPL|nr:hypothetical protein HPP92_009327 [Vanilla planifolia]